MEAHRRECPVASSKNAGKAKGRKDSNWHLRLRYFWLNKTDTSTFFLRGKTSFDRFVKPRGVTQVPSSNGKMPISAWRWQQAQSAHCALGCSGSVKRRFCLVFFCFFESDCVGALMIWFKDC